MLVPLELAVISRKKGYISPELSIGWRVGVYAREFFSDPQETLIAAKVNDDAVIALRWFTHRSLWGDQVTISEREGQWDFLIYHPNTGTLLQMIRCRKLTDFPPFMKSIEDNLNLAENGLVADYRRTMNQLIVNILGSPIESIFLIIEHRCRRITVSKDVAVKRKCTVCGLRLVNHDIWDIDGKLYCLNCSILEPSWFIYH